MNHSTLLFLVAIMISFGWVRAQTLQPKVVATAGRYAVSSNISLSYTVGEAVVTTASASGTILTQGFHQPYKNAVGINLTENFVSVQVYPNPTVNYIRLAAKGITESLTIHLYSLNGQLLQKLTYHPPNPLDINLNEYSDGMYLLQLISTSGQIQGVYRIEKIS